MRKLGDILVAATFIAFTVVSCSKFEPLTESDTSIESLEEDRMDGTDHCPNSFEKSKMEDTKITDPARDEDKDVDS